MDSIRESFGEENEILEEELEESINKSEKKDKSYKRAKSDKKIRKK